MKVESGRASTSSEGVGEGASTEGEGTGDGSGRVTIRSVNLFFSVVTRWPKLRYA